MEKKNINHYLYNFTVTNVTMLHIIYNTVLDKRALKYQLLKALINNGIADV